MSDTLVISGVRPYDGRYPFDLAEQELTTREWGWLKRLAGYLPLTLLDGFKGGDPELLACFAVIALHRANRLDPLEVTSVYERFLDVPFGAAVRLELGQDEEADAGPPDGSSNGSSVSSGPASSTSSTSPADTPKASGTPASGFSPSPPQTWAT